MPNPTHALLLTSHGGTPQLVTLEEVNRYRERFWEVPPGGDLTVTAQPSEIFRPTRFYLHAPPGELSSLGVSSVQIGLTTIFATSVGSVTARAFAADFAKEAASLLGFDRAISPSEVVRVKFHNFGDSPRRVVAIFEGIIGADGQA